VKPAIAALALTRFGGQMLYVAPRKDVVVAYFGTNATLDAPPEPLPLSQLVDELR
jgi:hypothetical protein